MNTWSHWTIRYDSIGEVDIFKDGRKVDFEENY